MSYKPAFQNKPRVHCDLIKAWADGAIIQELGYLARTGPYWHQPSTPTWEIDKTYRIKPNESV